MGALNLRFNSLMPYPRGFPDAEMIPILFVSLITHKK